MNNPIITKALLHISENPFSFNHHLTFWKHEAENIEKNPRDFILAINSLIFNWCYKSNFSLDFKVNPVSLAIVESGKFSDFLLILRNNLGLLVFEKQLIYGLMPVYKYYLEMYSTNEIKNLHPYFNFVLADLLMIVDEIKVTLKEKQINAQQLNYVQNLSNLFLNEIYFDGVNFSFNKMNERLFWKIIAFGVSVPVDKLEERFMESKESILFDRKVLISNFQDYYIEGKIPLKLKKRFPLKEHQDNIVNFLEDIKNRPSFALLLGLK